MSNRNRIHPPTETTGSLIMRFELCWHQFKRVRGGLDGQIRVMRFLHNHGPSTQIEIQEALGIKSPAMSEHITKLEKQGYITRTPSEKDRRARIIQFTPAGKRRSAPSWRRRPARTCSPLSPRRSMRPCGSSSPSSAPTGASGRAPSNHILPCRKVGRFFFPLFRYTLDSVRDACYNYFGFRIILSQRAWFDKMIVKELNNGYWRFCVQADAPACVWLRDIGPGYALIGSVPERYATELWEALVPFTMARPLLYMICPGSRDDVTFVRAVTQHYPDICVIAGKAVLFTLDSLGIRPARTIEIRADRTLTLGNVTFDLHMSANRFLTATDRETQLSFGKSALPPAPKTEPEGRPTVAVIHTGGSIIGLLAKSVSDGILSYENGAPKVLDLDLTVMDRDEVLAALAEADAYIFGSEGRDGNVEKAVWDIVTSLRRRDVSGKRAAVFYTQNAGDPIPDMLRAYLSALGMKLDMPDWFVSGIPTEKDLKNAVDYGFGLACCVLGVPNPRQPKLVKCLVCGEIFDASLGACPVCGVGLDQCVPVEEDEISYRNDTDRTYLIIGGCSAGVAAAESIRQRDTTGKIILLSAEEHLPINRPMITKGVIDEVVAAPETIYIHPSEWYAERRIDLRLGVTATAVHPETKTVDTADGTIYNYDKLILAVGAECFMPPFQGHELDGVISVRHLSDAADMVERMRTCKSAVVIGGGVLGLEAAGELMKSAIPVTVLEATPQIMWKQVDAGSSAYLRELMKKAHIDCYEGISVEAIEGNADGHVTGVRLGDGRFFPADIVIVSCGMKANTKLAVDAGVKADRAIEVDMFMRTSVPDIYACGDCCAYDGVNYQLVQEANAQGRVAGAHAAGDDSLYYANRVLGMHVEGVGATMYAIGDAGKKAELSYKTVEANDAVVNRKETYWFARGILQGAVVINADEKIQLLTQSLEMKARHSEMF